MPDTVLNDLQILSCLILKLMPRGKSETGFSGGWRTLRHRLLSLLVKTGLQEPDELSICEYYLKWRCRNCWTQSLLEAQKAQKDLWHSNKRVASTQSGQLMTRWALCPSSSIPRGPGPAPRYTLASQRSSINFYMIGYIYQQIIGALSAYPLLVNL